jgi:hypothetical protein
MNVFPENLGILVLFPVPLMGNGLLVLPSQILLVGNYLLLNQTSVLLHQER